VNAAKARALFLALSSAIAQGVVRACHDCSEGGIGVAMAEMAFAGGLGATVALDKIPLAEQIGRDDFILFSESNSRFIVEIAVKDKDKFEKQMTDLPVAFIGQVIAEKKLIIQGLSGEVIVEEGIADLKESWQKTLRW
jgi:phosphoribosylformylglycinamidine synthase subunit PurSL